MQSVLEILQKCAGYFAAKGIETPKLDAELLLAHALGCKRLELFLRFEEPLPEAKLAPFREMAKRRARREPLQHIIGSVDFFGLTLKCDARALVPRHETETLCEIAVEKLLPDASAKPEILDLGTGSGAIALAMASACPNASVDAAEISDAAISLATENAESLKLKINIVKSNWFENIKKSYNLILANPPYLDESEVREAQPEVRNYDPPSALSSPDGGLRDLRKILSEAREHLLDGGFIACECGLGQPQILAREAVEKFGFSEARALPDLSKRERFLICKK